MGQAYVTPITRLDKMITSNFEDVDAVMWMQTEPFVRNYVV